MPKRKRGNLNNVSKNAREAALRRKNETEEERNTRLSSLSARNNNSIINETENEKNERFHLFK